MKWPRGEDEGLARERVWRGRRQGLAGNEGRLQPASEILLLLESLFALLQDEEQRGKSRAILRNLSLHCAALGRDARWSDWLLALDEETKDDALVRVGLTEA